MHLKSSDEKPLLLKQKRDPNRPANAEGCIGKGKSYELIRLSKEVIG